MNYKPKEIKIFEDEGIYTLKSDTNEIIMEIKLYDNDIGVNKAQDLLYFMEILYNTRMYKYKPTKDNVYGAIERQLRDEKFKVKHLMRDERGDWGDDGGYIISISEKNDKTYLHIIHVNYNVKIDVNVLDETYPHLKEGEKLEDVADFIICHSIEDAQNTLNKLVDDLKVVIDLVENKDNYYFNNGWIDETEEKPQYFNGYAKCYLNMLASCYFSFSEYIEWDEPKLRTLTKTPYIADYNDPDEYLVNH